MFPSLEPLAGKTETPQNKPTVPNDIENDVNKTVNANEIILPKPFITQAQRDEATLHGEEALLDHIERNHDSFDSRTNREETTKHSVFQDKINNLTSPISHSPHSSRRRRGSRDFPELGAFENNGAEEKSCLSYHRFMDYFGPKFAKRYYYYCVGFVFMAMIVITRKFTHLGQWVLLYSCSVTLDLISSIIDEAIFVYIIDRMFINHYDTAYLLHGFNGPLGLIIELIFVELYFDRLEATTLFPSYHSFISGVTIVLLCFCVKIYFTRKYYITLLEKRFADRLFKLETYNILLSELATAKPPKKFEPNPLDWDSNNKTPELSMKSPKDLIDLHKELLSRVDILNPLIKTVETVQGELYSCNLMIFICLFICFET
jgi:hypothetical protein